MEFGSKVSDGEFHAPRQYAGGLHAELHDHAENDQSQDIFPVLFSDKQTQKRDRDVGTDEHIEIPQMHSASLAQEHVIHKNLHVEGRALDKRNKNSPPCGIKEQPEQEQQNNGQQVFAVKSTWRFILLFIQQQCAGQHHKHGRARAAQAVEDVPDHKGRVVSPAEIGDHIGRYMDHDNHGNRYNSDDVIAQYSLAGHMRFSSFFCYCPIRFSETSNFSRVPADQIPGTSCVLFFCSGRMKRAVHAQALCILRTPGARDWVTVQLHAIALFHIR